MERRGNNSFQRSSLPKSLIPHLYNTPQTSRDSSTRTTLPEHEDGEEGETSSQALSGQPSSSFVLRPILAEMAPDLSPITPRRYHARHPIYEDPSSLRDSTRPSFSGSIHRHSVGPPIVVPLGPPIRSDPAYYASIARQAQGPQQDYISPPMDVPSQLPYTSASSMWREGEAGPSSMASTAFRYNDQRAVGRDPEYPLRSSRPDSFRYAERPGEYRQPDLSRHLILRDDTESHPGYGAYNQGQQHGLVPLLAPLPITRRVPDLMLYSSSPREEQDQYTLPTLPPLSSSSGSSQRVWSVGDTSSSSGVAEYSSGHFSSLPPITPPGGSTADPDDSGPDYTPQIDRKRQQSTTAPESGRAKAGKKTLIACDFCRGRKLRCDGTRPSCFNCKSRENQVCVYQPYPRRRGPGKASKGAKAKRKAAAEKARTSEMLTPPSDYRQQENSGSDFDMERIGPSTETSATTLHLPRAPLDPSLAGAPYTLPPDDELTSSSSRIRRQHRSRTGRDSDSEEKFNPRRN